MKQYNFHGWQEAANVHVKYPVYPGIETPLDLYDRLEKLWCAQTCAPRLRPNWSESNRTLGQCSITAFLAQDLFGGEVFGMATDNGGIHCYNRVDGAVFDLTDAQFGQKAKELVYDCSWLQDRESAAHFAKEEKRCRYEFLKSKLK